MALRKRWTPIFLALAGAGALLSWAVVRFLAPASPGLAAITAALVTALLVLGVMALLSRLLFAPADRLTRSLRSVRENRSADANLAQVSGAMLGDLHKECDEIVTALRDSRRQSRIMAQSESARIDSQKSWLEAIVQGLSEGVFVCNPQHRILLYNPAAVSLLDAPDRIGLGRSLGDVLDLGPIRHSLNRLEHRHASDPDSATELSAPFVCTSADREVMLNGRMALLTDAGGHPSGYLVTLVDISNELALLAKGDGVRRALTRDMRGMVGNLRAAAETLADHPEMESDSRAAFEAIIVDESVRLSDKLEELGSEIRGHMLGRWPMADIFVTDLARFLEQNLEGSGIRVSLVGIPLWLHGDSLSLVQALEHFVRSLSEVTGAKEFELEPMLGDKRVYLDLIWGGAPLQEGVLESWMDQVCSVEMGGQRLRDILERHGSEPWSTETGRPGCSMLRLPLLAPNRPQFIPTQRKLPARPEFYDFGLMQAHQGDAELAARPLREVSYVVFDCEMTGLQPLQGDEVIQIGAVRIVQDRVLTGEGAEWLINPGRPIPPASIKFHGLTDADVADKPPISEVLPLFRSFVGDAVMVGHNAAFDLKFLTLKERSANVRFDNPVLDTMLISSMLDGEEEDHSLDALCDRYGISIAGRHTALGDTIGTAELLLKMIDRLEAKGLNTFGEVMKASNMAAELRHRDAIIAHGARTAS